MAVEDYSWADRLVHRIAFGTSTPQRLLTDIELSRFCDLMTAQQMGPPIFVTSLPRAGTTLLLEVLACHPSTATHISRDMPFVLSPAIWQNFSQRYRGHSPMKERSHGDGMMVGPESPEAFEEVFWLREIPGDFARGQISLRETVPDDTVRRLVRLMHSVATARGPEATRYVSKNNANIARLPALAKAFPEARILIPLRHPIDQAHSLLRQHRRALASQASGGFTSAWPRDVGHFEFGLHHRPIGFAGMERIMADHSPDSLDYWLAYWIAAMRHISVNGIGEIIDMATFTRSAQGVAALFQDLALAPAPQAQAHAQDMIRPIASYDNDGCTAFEEEALELYRNLRRRAARFDAANRSHRAA
ncbi:sulfotransferase [Aurantiacibacter spongiae]|uniref:Sulfotransferase n=1 Tax=Aurantiacibacter spongiae TaxID=2488860 RepID=A0A3N5CR19_9SPHN|nr:sulfotransferase [Aurantiacibacter spongiae]RPF71067.1 sulfotransferase [Aurantiacibacter spongiae]